MICSSMNLFFRIVRLLSTDPVQNKDISPGKVSFARVAIARPAICYYLWRGANT